MRPHFILPMRSNPQIAARLSATQEHKTRSPIFRIIFLRVGFVDSAR
jgi:hypothetical protein